MTHAAVVPLEQRAEARRVAVSHPLDQLFVGYCLHGRSSQPRRQRRAGPENVTLWPATIRKTEARVSPEPAHGSQFRLLQQRRFLPFFGAQAFGAFNDNVYKNVLVIVATYH